ncbi:MAG: S41 family peptidase [Urechidicola sp.]|nr:S41 family peptidase [Urechidicola sp.]
MKTIKIYLALAILLIIGFSCKNDDNENIPADVEVQNFIWKGLNAFYFWQQDLPNLSDQRFSSQEQLNGFLIDYPIPEELFYNLLNNYPTTDKYSWIVDDYLALEDLLQNGIIGSNGVEFGLVLEAGSEIDVFGYVRYIIPNSDASTKNILRGDIFHAVNGIPLTVNNFRELLFISESYTLNFADYNNGNPVDNGIAINLIKNELQENPIYNTDIYEVSGKKIGYLMYNAFTPLYDNQLNDVFAMFKNDGVTDLVLDLRYNSGGSVRSATYLASMVTGQYTGELFSKEQWNNKWQDYFLSNDPSSVINNFTNQIIGGPGINSLNLDNIVILTTGSSASASELVINGLNPYIELTTIGTTTEGKTVGSITLYDSNNYRREDANRNHAWAMQPIVLEIQNKNGENFPEGFEPGIYFPEDFGDLGIIGEIDEPLLGRAISFITTGSRIAPSSFENNLSREFSSSKVNTRLGSNMFVDKKLPL